MNKTFLNYSNKQGTNDRMTYLAGHTEWYYDRHNYNIRFSHSVEIQRKYSKVYLLYLWHFGKVQKVANIYNRFDDTFDVDIHENRRFGKYEFRRDIFKGNYKTLHEAVKALYLHYKED